MVSSYHGAWTFDKVFMGTPKSPEEIEAVAATVMSAAIHVHKTLGPGLMESTYLKCLCAELAFNKVSFEREVWLPIKYRDIRIENAYRMDLLVEKCVVIELKTVEELKPVHVSQLLTYLRLTGLWLGNPYQLQRPRAVQRRKESFERFP